MGKAKINHIGAFGIIYPKHDPSQIFIEIKDDSHPIEKVRRKLCCIGGNWIDEVAKEDISPLDTFSRECREELSFTRPLHTSGELVMMGLVSHQPFHIIKKPLIQPDDVDQQALLDVKSAIAKSAKSFGDFINTALSSLIGVENIKNNQEYFSWLSSYYVVPLSKEHWDLLVMLQEKFKNLSNESLTLIISLKDILQMRLQAAFGHDYALKEFFLSQGFAEAKKLPLTLELESKRIGFAMSNYKDYLQKYYIERHP